jgi:hypothetical protein
MIMLSEDINMSIARGTAMNVALLHCVERRWVSKYNHTFPLNCGPVSFGL